MAASRKMLYTKDGVGPWTNRDNVPAICLCAILNSLQMANLSKPVVNLTIFINIIVDCFGYAMICNSGLIVQSRKPKRLNVMETK